MDIDITDDEQPMLWQLACALLPAHSFSLEAALRSAILQRNALLSKMRPEEGGLVVQKQGGTRLLLFSRKDRRWELLRRPRTEE